MSTPLPGGAERLSRLSLPLLVGRLRPLAAEMSKFVVVGGFCFLLDFALAFFLYRKVGLGPTTSKAISTVVATGVSYLGNRLWSFSHRVDADSSHGRDLTRYCLIAVAGLLITLVPVDVVHYALGLTSSLAFNVSGVVGTAFATMFRFYAYRRWVFSAPADLYLAEPPAASDTDAVARETLAG